MPLRKLWNSLRGVPTSRGGAETPRPTSEPQQAPARPKKTQKSAGKKSVARGDKPLCRRLLKLSPGSLLEVGVGDGQRALSMIATLTHKGHSTPLHYLAVDQFELGGSELTLRAFHTRLREYPAKVHLIPMDVRSGLDRVARTFGQVDVILWGPATPPTAEQRTQLHRICKAGTVLLAQVEGEWTELERSPIEITTSRRAA